METNNYDNALLRLRFTGSTLNLKGVPIYDLAESLTAIQRSIHFTHAVLNNEAERGYLFSKQMRERLAFEIGGRKRASDGYGLLPLVTDPEALRDVKDAVALVLYSIQAYTQQLGIASIRDARITLPSGLSVIGNKALFAYSSIFNQVATIGQRMGGFAEIDGAEFSSGDGEIQTIAKINPDTKKYLAELRNRVLLGDPIWEFGLVDAIFPTNDSVRIKNQNQQTVYLDCSEMIAGDLESLSHKDCFIACYGDPIFKLGIESKFVDRIKVKRIRILPVSSRVDFLPLAHQLSNSLNESATTINLSENSVFDEALETYTRNFQNEDDEDVSD